MPESVVFPKANVERSSGEISTWSVAEGDQVSAGDILFEVEDDKAVVEVESPSDGYIGGLIEAGEEVDVGSIVATIYDTKEELQAAASDARPTAASTPSTPARVVAPEPVRPASATGKTISTPLARRIARDNGVSLDGIAGTGPNGRVQKKDVLARLGEGSASQVDGGVQQARAPAVPPPSGSLNTFWYQEGQGTPVVFLHGFAADATSWGGMLSGAAYDWPALALDLPCHGGSGVDLPADLDAIAARVETTLVQEGVTELMLAAHSFGSAVAARLASRGALRIKAMCLFAPAGLGPEINADFVAAMVRVRSAEGVRPWLRQLVDDPQLIGDLFVDRTVAARASDAQFEALQRFGHHFFPDGTQRFNVLEDLARYLGPLRVVHGRQDRILPVDATRNLPGNAALHLWDKCGHMPHFEHRRDALRILQEVRRSADSSDRT